MKQPRATCLQSCDPPPLGSHCTFAAAGDEVFVVTPEAGVDCVEALGHTLVLPHQHPVLEVPQVHSLDAAAGGDSTQ